MSDGNYWSIMINFLNKTLITFCLVLLSLAAIPQNSFANTGGEISYQWVSDSTYRIFFKLYRDCGGNAEPDSQLLCLYNPCNSSFANVVYMHKWTGALLNGTPNGSPVNPACPGYLSRCFNASSTIKDYTEWWYTAVVTLNGKCNSWRFATWINPRQASNNLTSGNLYIEATFNNQLFQGNTSPFFSIKPPTVICANQSYTYNNGSVDIADNDSLVTDVINPLTGGTCNSSPSNLAFASASPSYSIPYNPIQTNNSFSVNSTTGAITYTPTLVGPSTIAVRVREYRNGVLIGSVMRDMQVDVTNSCTIASPSLNVISSTVSGGSYSNGIINSCPESALSFCFYVKSADATSVLVLSDNHVQQIPGASIGYTNQGKDSVRGCLNWSPQISDTGFKTLIIITKDSSCKPPGILPASALTIPINIWPPTKAFKDTSICPGSSVTITAHGGGNFLWNALSGGVSSLSCTLCNSPVVKPASTTQYTVESLLNPYCNSTKDTITVTVLPTAIFSPLKDTTTCPNTPVTLDLHANPPAGVSYTYNWSPSASLSNPAISNPTAKPNTTTTYYITIGNSINSCLAYDTVKVIERNGFHIITPDTAICVEGIVNVKSIGDPGYTYAWSSPNAPANSVKPVNSLNTVISGNIVGKFLFVLKGSYPGCLDSLDSIQVDVQPYPHVSTDPNVSICLGASIQINGYVSPSNYPFIYIWKPATSLNSGSIINPTFYAKKEGIDTLTFIATTTAGCKDSAKIAINVYTKELLSLSNHDTAICGGDTIQLHLLSNNGVKSFAWFPNYFISDPRAYEPLVFPVATQTYTAKAADAYSCADSISITITVKPAAVINMPDTVHIYPGDSYFIQPHTNCLFFSWMPITGLNFHNISDPVATPDTTTKYYVNANTEFGCKVQDSIVILMDEDSYIDMPNAFTPTLYVNNIFKPVHLGKIKLDDFSIYNRWGMKVFQSANIEDGWDGKYQGEIQPMDVYVYMINATTFSGKKIFKHGNVTLIR